MSTWRFTLAPGPSASGKAAPKVGTRAAKPGWIMALSAKVNAATMATAPACSASSPILPIAYTG